MNFFALLLYPLHYFRYSHCCWFGYIHFDNFFLSLFPNWIYWCCFTQFFRKFCDFFFFLLPSSFRTHTRKYIETTVCWLVILYIVCLRREKRAHFIVDWIKFSNGFWFKQKKYSTSLWIINFYWKSSPFSAAQSSASESQSKRNFSSGFPFLKMNEKSNRRKSIQSIHNFIQTKTIHVVAP